VLKRTVCLSFAGANGVLFYEKYLADIDIMKQLGVKVMTPAVSIAIASVYISACAGAENVGQVSAGYTLVENFLVHWALLLIVVWTSFLCSSI
jgi:hypothetical protein